MTPTRSNFAGQGKGLVTGSAMPASVRVENGHRNKDLATGPQFNLSAWRNVNTQASVKSAVFGSRRINSGGFVVKPFPACQCEVTTSDWIAGSNPAALTNLRMITCSIPLFFGTRLGVLEQHPQFS